MCIYQLMETKSLPPILLFVYIRRFAKHATDDLSVGGGPVVITDGAPCVVIEYLHTALVYIRSIPQSHSHMVCHRTRCKSTKYTTRYSQIYNTLQSIPQSHSHMVCHRTRCKTTHIRKVTATNTIHQALQYLL